MSNNLNTICGILCAAIIFGSPLCWIVAQAVRREACRVGIVFFLAFIAVALFADIALKAGGKPEPTPVITVKDIEIRKYKCDHTGLELSWECGTNVTVGVDKFIIRRQTRTLPDRTRWSDWEDFAETYDTNFVSRLPYHATDNRWKIVVRKEAQ